MERRALLKIAVLTAVSQRLQAFPQAAMAPMQGAPDTSYTLQFFTAEESQLLDQLMEMILPADDHSPGAHAAKTNLFADLMVASSTDADKQRWRNGLRLMREEGARSSLDGALETAAANEEKPVTELDHFFVSLKQMTVQGYYTSAIGIHQELAYEGNTYLKAFPECTHPEHIQTSNSSSSNGVSG